MFKSLIATALLSASVGAKLPQRSSAMSDVSGAYCVRDDIGLIETDYGYTFTYEFSGSGIYMYNDTENAYLQVVSLSFEYDNHDLEFNVDTINVHNYRFTFTENIDFDDISADFSTMVLYFTGIRTLPRYAYNLFLTVFSANSNPNTTYYNGWYNFNYNQSFPPYNVTLFGNITVDNRLFNHIDYTTSTITANYDGYEINSYYIDIYNGGWQIQSRNMYFIGLIPNTLRLSMLANGTFEYIPLSYDSDFQDLFFSIADTPIKFITDMFNFELLGMSLGAAFMSLATLLMVVIIIKKVI